MAILYEQKKGRTEEYAAVTGYEGSCTCLRIPEELLNLEGVRLPIREISAHAFDGRQELKEVWIPASVEILRPFAFFNCRSLQTLHLTDRVRDYHDAVIRQCSSLSLVELRFFEEGNYQLLREMLGDNDRKLRFHLLLPEGEAEFVVPAYVDEIREDTMSRTIHESIAGSGYEYRQTVSRRGIDWRGYDRLFSRVIHDDPDSAEEVALARLRYPLQLSVQAEQRYSEFVEERCTKLLRRLTEERRHSEIRFLADRGLLTEQAIREVLSYCAKHRLSELTALLMEFERQHFAGRRRPESFSLPAL